MKKILSSVIIVIIAIMFVIDIHANPSFGISGGPGLSSIWHNGFCSLSPSVDFTIGKPLPYEHHALPPFLWIWASGGLKYYKDNQNVYSAYAEAGITCVINVGCGYDWEFTDGKREIKPHLFFGIPFFLNDKHGPYLEPYYRITIKGDRIHEAGILVKYFTSY